MQKIGWVVVFVLVVMQFIFALELMELSSLMKQTASIDEKTAIMRNEAAAKALETERIRANYYRVLVTSPFKLTEEEAKGIIRQGIKE
jgi:hypothetical protein